jgi:hypothetical protein
MGKTPTYRVAPLSLQAPDIAPAQYLLNLEVDTLVVKNSYNFSGATGYINVATTTGPTGPQGIHGPTGAQGSPGTSSNTGATGPTGASITISNSAYQRVLISNTGGTGAIAMSNLTMDDNDITLRVGPYVTPNLVPDGSISNIIVCANNNHAELNTTTFGAGWEPSVVQLHARGTLSSPQPVQQDDIIGQYFTRGFCTGAAGATQFTGAFYNTSFINMRADYVGAAANYVGGRIIMRTKGDTTDTYGKARLDITNAGLVRFYDDNNGVAYSMPQTVPSLNSVLYSTDNSGNLGWKDIITNNNYTGAVWVSRGPNDFAYAENNLLFDDTKNTLTLGSVPPNGLIPDDNSLTNFVVADTNKFVEVNLCQAGNGLASFINHYCRGTLDSPLPVVQNDLLGRYICRGLPASGASYGRFMDSAAINIRADYSGSATNCVGGRIVFRTRGDRDATDPGNYGYERMDITNQGQVRFYNNNNGIAYTMPQTGPAENSVLCSTGTAGELYWKGPDNTLQTRMTGVLDVAAGTNLLIPFDFVEVNTINGLSYDIRTRKFQNISSSTRKYMFNLQTAMTGSSAGEADIWFSTNGVFDTFNRFGQVASYTQNSLMTTSWLFTLAPSEFVYCYAWNQSNYSIGSAINGNAAGWSTKVRVTELN